MESQIITWLVGFAVGILVRGEQNNGSSGPWGGEGRVGGSSTVLYIIFVLLVIAAVFLAKDLLR